MRLGTIAVAATATLVLTISVGAAAADAQTSLSDRLSKMEQRIQHLEKRVASQDAVIVEKDREIARLGQQDAKASDRWFDRIELTGGVELEAAYSSPFTGDDTSDATLATATIGVSSQIHDWVAASVSLLHEEDETPLEVDIATLTIAPPEGMWSFTGGQLYVPFGSYESNLISDPLTLEIGETRETALVVGVAGNGFSGAAYGFNGTNKDGGDNHIDGFGAAVGYGFERDDSRFAVTLGFINDVGDSDNLQDAIAGNLGSNNVTDHVPAWTASIVTQRGPFTLIGEYLAALDEFQPGEVPFGPAGAQPAAWNVEAGYGFTLAGRQATFAVAWQGSDEALALELPQYRYLAGLSVEIVDHTTLSFEYRHDEDYGTGDGGTGNSADTATAQLAVEF